VPRKPDAANLENRIRKLREQFRLTQDRFGELLGMNGDAIRNLENGRQKISGTILRRIITLVGAEYSTKNKIWKVPLSRMKCSPATLRAWRQAAKPSNKLKSEDFEALSCRLAALLAYSKPEEYNALFMTLSELLDDLLEQHPSLEAKMVFKKSEPQMTMGRSWKNDTNWAKTALVNDEEASVAEEIGLPTHPFPYPISEIREVARSYESFPKAADLLPKDIHEGDDQNVSLQ
jgi:transcriptional regulator with XRE-family HTH domain